MWSVVDDEKNMIKLVLGMVVAAACSLAVAYLAGCVLIAAVTVRYPAGVADETDSIFVICAVIASGASFFLVPAILILSIPLHLLATKLGLVRGRDYAIAGAIVGLCVYLGVQLAAQTTLPVLEIPEPMAIPALFIAPMLGAAAALGFWIVSRPDKATSRQEK